MLREKYSTWAFITAENPYSKKLSDVENQLRFKQLMEVIRKMDLDFLNGLGVPSDSSWTPEKSLLVLGLSKEEALSLGKQFDQQAIVFGEYGGEAELIIRT